MQDGHYMFLQITINAVDKFLKIFTPEKRITGKYLNTRCNLFENL